MDNFHEHYNKTVIWIDEKVDNNGKRVFNQLNGSPLVYGGTQKSLKAALLSMHGSQVLLHTLEIL